MNLGRIAFNAYCRTVEGVTYDGRIIPGWDKLTDEVQAAWENAGQAAAAAFHQDLRPDEGVN